jgi:4-alpha-glucanotransferase
MIPGLDELAERYGILVAHTGLDGVRHEVPHGTKLSILAAMGVAADSEAAIAESLQQAPDVGHGGPISDVRCFIPGWMEHHRCWGIALQLYALRSARNWGIGDFEDLAAFSATAASAGADFLGVNPLHAMFLADPERCSPFSPSNRRFLNPIYIAVDAIPGFAPGMVDAAAIAAVRAGDFVDYRAVVALKLSALRVLWPLWKNSGNLPANYGHRAFDDFVRSEGEPLRRHGLFEALSMAMVAEGYRSGWETWPDDLRWAESAEVSAFAATNAHEIAFHCWLQWLARVQLNRARDVCHGHGMRIGLYLDFAVGEAPDGSAAWGDPSLTMRDVHVGAPPDYFSAGGQDWQLAPLSPAALVEPDARPYHDMIRDNMRYGGALRIDHAMGISQLFLVPRGRSPADGAYVRYPTANIIRTLASASHEHQTVVIGEDLGNVPVGFRDIMAAAGMLSYRILYFERHGDRFAWPADYPRDALACLSTHDLPTLEGWWRGEDIHLRHEHGLIGQEDAELQARQRAEERDQLSAMLHQSGLASPDEAETARQAAYQPDAPLPPFLVVAMHAFLAWAPSRMLAARLEDMAGEREPVNLPGTIDSYPNWQRKLKTPIEQVGDAPLFIAVAEAMAKERPRQS